tara:strand:+ start:253 stop:468 length:216 start_codon:yes stop_codon:yes gene_type:complete
LNVNEILSKIPSEVLELRKQGQLHKLAQARTGIDDFGLDTAVGFIAKKAFYNRQVNKAIAASINSLDYINK